MQGKKKDKQAFKKEGPVPGRAPGGGRRGKSKVLEEAGMAQVERTRRASRSEELPW